MDNNFTKKQLEAIRKIRNWSMHFGRTPSVRDLMKDLGYKSPKSIQDILKSLEERKVIEKLENGGYKLIYNPDLGMMHAQTVNVPLVGEVACGSPILAQENIEAMIPVSTSMAKSGYKYYLLHATGDSMNEAGINNGDLLLIRQQSTAEEGQKVVALIDDGATVKEFHKTKNAIILKPRSKNKNHKPIILTEDFQIQGVVVGTIPNAEI
jgi:repressor LexA